MIYSVGLNQLRTNSMLKDVRGAHEASVSKPGDDLTKVVQLEKRLLTQLELKEIYTRMKVERRLSSIRIKAMLEDLQTQIFAIYQKVIQRRQKVFAEVDKMWSKLLFD